MKKLDATHRLFAKADAIKIAAEMKAGDPDWDYRPVHCPKGTGFSFIEIFDEDGQFVARV
jgi:hypothetical protein